MLGKTLIQAASGGGEIEPLAEPLVFICSRDSSNIGYLHGLTTSGTKIGTWQSPETLNGCYAFFRNPYLYFSPAYTSTKIYKINCNTMTLSKIITLPRSISSTFFQPISQTQLIGVDVVADTYVVLDLTGDTVLSTSYSSIATTVAQTSATLSFFDETSSTLSNIQSRVWFQGGNTSGAGYISYGDWNGSALSAENSTFINHNQSRGMGFTLSSTKGVLHIFGNRLWRVTPTATTPTQVTPQTLSYGGASYSYSQESYERSASTGSSSTYMYVPFLDSSPGTAGYNVRIAAIDPFASTSPTPVDLGLPLDRGYYYFNPQEGGFCSRINEADYVAIVNYDVLGYGATTDRVNIDIFNGTTKVTAYTCNLGTQYTSGNNSDYRYHTIFPAMWSTDLLYAGSTYS